MLLTIASPFVGCTEASKSWVEVANQRFTVALAVDEPARQEGLMHRQSMPLDHGMLFVFSDEQPRAFWMKNTLIALDIIYADRHGRIVKVLRDVPPCRSASCPSYPSDAPAKFTLELNAGSSVRHGIEVGAILTLAPEIPRDGQP
ncbi:MAG: DUF192 domain-containing protein [Aquimonas sp.]|jgi:uncharacterized membrane protein (UPF0127 family)|nr:DUF192 domain-containing protein [Xanthomonadales bacterium]MCC6507223.1 DUF192 domain-containing protein [Aquimonas sp.]